MPEPLTRTTREDARSGIRVHLTRLIFAVQGNLGAGAESDQQWNAAVLEDLLDLTAKVGDVLLADAQEKP